MIFEHFVVGMLQTNCYLLGDTPSRQAILVDPGGDAPALISRIKKLGLQLQAILITHGHFDHVMDASKVKAELGGEILIHPLDEPMLAQSIKPAAGESIPSADRHVREGDMLLYGAIELKVLETPGHSRGHVSYYFQKANAVFVGDTLFAGSIGRTDLPGGSYDQLLKSVRTKIFPLHDETLVYPGHGPETTVGKEKRMNPFFIR